MYMNFWSQILRFRYRVGPGHPVRVLRKSQEVHTRHQDGVRRPEEGERTVGPDRLLGERVQVNDSPHARHHR